MDLHGALTILSVLAIAYIFVVMVIRAYFAERVKYVSGLMAKLKERKRHG